MSMEAYENLQFESEVYFKLKEAEYEAEMSNKRYSSKDVLKSMYEAIGAEAVQAMHEAERIAGDPSVKGYNNLDKMFADLEK